MDKSFLIKELYKRVRNDSGGDTQTMLEFLNWLHYEKNEVVYLKDMKGLTRIEEQYIEQLLDGKIPKKNREEE